MKLRNPEGVYQKLADMVRGTGVDAVLMKIDTDEKLSTAIRINIRGLATHVMTRKPSEQNKLVGEVVKKFLETKPIIDQNTGEPIKFQI